MRDDMAEVLVLRGRRGGGWQRRSWVRRQAQRPLEELPMRERMRPSGSRKWLGEYLTPLARFLGSRVGRPWDDVYGEVCEQIDRSNTVQRHVLEHLTGHGAFVELYPIWLRGRPHTWWGGGIRALRRTRFQRFHVDTEGVLRWNPR